MFLPVDDLPPRIALLLATAAQAVDVKVLSPADAATSTPALITIKGKLNEGDEGKFLGTLGTIRSAIIFLESPRGPWES